MHVCHRNVKFPIFSYILGLHILLLSEPSGWYFNLFKEKKRDDREQKQRKETSSSNPHKGN